MNPSKVIEYRLQSGGYAVVDSLKNVDMEKLIFSLYLPIKDEDTKRLVYFFEQQLILAKLDKKKFLKTRAKKIKEICRWIKDNNKYQLFADFSMYVYRNSDKGNLARSPVMIAYITTLMDVWASGLAPYGKMWYGFDKDGNPMFIDEQYGAYDIPSYEAWEKIEKLKYKNPALAQKLMAETIIKEEKNEFIRSDERNITNTVFSMIGLINSDNAKFIYPFHDWIDHCSFIRSFPRKYKPTEFWMDMLDKRSFLLNSQGVTVRCINAGGFFHEIRFKEEFLEDGMIVLFRVTDKDQGKHTMGFIDLRKRFTYSVLKHATDTMTGECIHDDFINFILEVYCELTCIYEKNTNRFVAMKRLNSLKETDTLNEGQPAIFIYLKDVSESKGISKQVTQKTMHNVDAFIRKGNASEEAKANARNYGLILPQGYTFVRPHIRGKKQLAKSYKKL